MADPWAKTQALLDWFVANSQCFIFEKDSGGAGLYHLPGIKIRLNFLLEPVHLSLGLYCVQG